MNVETINLLLALAQAVYPVIAEKYPAIPQVAAEVVGISMLASRFVRNEKVKGVLGMLGGLVDRLGMYKPKA